MKTPAPADLQRWSDEVARDPRSLAFLPLARAYRRQGQLAAATQLCLRGLEAYPAHVEAHGLMALLYLQGGNHQKAADEWSIVLRIDPDNFDALRGLGFCFLEQDRLSRARQLLEQAALLRPEDTAVQEALRLLGTRDQLAAGTRSALNADDPWAAPAAVAVPAPPVPPYAATLAAGPSDPAALFDELLTGPLLGALLVDAQGLVLAGRLTDAVSGASDVLGAVLGGVPAEAERTVRHLSLGSWQGVLLECEHAQLHIAPVGDGVLVVAAPRSAPAGWLLRTAQQAAERAQHFLEQYQ